MNNGLPRSWRARRMIPGLLLAQVFAGCGGQGSTPPPDPPPPAWSSKVQSPDVSVDEGRFVGTVRMGGVSYYGDAIVTRDGQVRLYVGAADAADGGLTSAQLVGTLKTSGSAARGNGIVVAERCSDVGPGRFCNAPAPAEISIGLDAQKLTGEIRVGTDQGSEQWQLDLDQRSADHGSTAALSGSAGLYYERLAEFAGGATVLSIDAAGALFFQSAWSGCTGVGTLSPRADGQFLVYDVSVAIGSCDEAHASLNAGFSGLASISEDSVLRFWLSSGDTQQPVAITMQASGDPI